MTYRWSVRNLQKVVWRVLTVFRGVRIVRFSADDADKNEAKRMSLAEWV